MKASLSQECLRRLAVHLHVQGPANAIPGLKPGGSESVSLLEAAERLGVSQRQLIKGLADLEDMPYLDLSGLMPTPEALAAMPEVLARRYGVLPMFLYDSELTIAVGAARPPVLEAIRRALPSLDIIFVLADEAEIQPIADLAYPSAAEAAVADFLATDAGQAGTPLALASIAGRAPIVQMVDAILERAARLGASDVHIEPGEHVSHVRVRVEGLMRPMFTFSGSLQEPVISRLKVLAELNIAERQRPQEGRFSFMSSNRVVDARISMVRTHDGEKAVLRLLMHGDRPVRQLSELGLPPAAYEAFARQLSRPQGLILVTGPTGSGKTSTLYASVQHLRTPERNIMTLEDPVECRLPGINQLPVPTEPGAFPKLLRAALRQDPDIVMVGEIRDRETAEIAVQGALTGHLVLSTLHANDAARTITRLVQMGVEPINLSASLLAVVAQRLVRRLCACHGHKPATPAELEMLGLTGFGEVPLPVARGCLDCERTGYRGRSALFEVLIVDDAVQLAIATGAGPSALRAAARSAGNQTVWQAGVRAVLTDLTTLDELARVVGVPD